MTIHLYFDVLDDTTLRVLQSVREWRQRSIKIWTNREVVSNSPMKGCLSYIKEGVNIIDDLSLRYDKDLYEWQRNEGKVSVVCSHGIRALVSRKWAIQDCVVGIGNQAKEKELLICFFDKQGEKTLPEEFIKIVWLATIESLWSLCSEKGVFAFSLTDARRFERTGRRYGNASIFREKETGYYVYLDTFHGDHYEVFDSSRRHIGEYSMTGYLDFSKRDGSKRLDV